MHHVSRVTCHMSLTPSAQSWTLPMITTPIYTAGCCCWSWPRSINNDLQRTKNNLSFLQQFFNISVPKLQILTPLFVIDQCDFKPLKIGEIRRKKKKKKVTQLCCYRTDIETYRLYWPRRLIQWKQMSPPPGILFEGFLSSASLSPSLPPSPPPPSNDPHKRQETSLNRNQRAPLSSKRACTVNTEPNPSKNEPKKRQNEPKTRQTRAPALKNAPLGFAHEAHTKHSNQ